MHIVLRYDWHATSSFSFMPSLTSSDNLTFPLYSTFVLPYEGWATYGGSDVLSCLAYQLLPPDSVHVGIWAPRVLCQLLETLETSKKVCILTRNCYGNSPLPKFSPTSNQLRHYQIPIPTHTSATTSVPLLPLGPAYLFTLTINLKFLPANTVPPVNALASPRAFNM